MKKIITLCFFISTFGLLKSQNAIQFNGTNAYVSFGNNANLGLSQFSLECWFKRLGSGSTTSTGTGGITGVPLITKGRGEADGSNVDMNYFLGIRQTDSTLVADFEEGASGTTPGLNHPIIGVTKLSRNVWYHVAITYDGSTWKLYLNGQLESQLTVSQPVQNLSIQHSAIASALTSNGTSQGFFNGIIDEVRIWNSARSQSQIVTNINAAITSTANGLVARWGLNEGSGSTVSSSAGITITGTLTGSNWSWVTQQAPFNLNIAPGTPTLVIPADTSKCHNTAVKLSVTVSDLDGDSLWVRFYGRKKNNAKDFSIIPLPDTQYYTSQINGASNAMYKSQMNWVVAKKDSLNIQFIAGLGDCVENGDNGGNDVEWKRADTSMKIVETNTSSIFPAGIPYGLNVGNHDQSPQGNPNGTTTFFNQYFGLSRFSGRNYWGGNYGSNADNNYQLFSAEGMDFIVINLEYDPAANSSVLAWANSLLQSYPNRRGIVASHWFLNLDATFGAQGQATYNALKNNPNFFLMLCGHVAGEARRAEVYNGRTVHCVLSDYQGRTNGGNGWIRIMKFRPSQNKIHVSTYSPYLKQSETDGDSQFILDCDFGGAYTLIDSVKVASGQVASINWSGLLNSTAYEWYAVVNDGSSTVKGQAYTFKTNAYRVQLPNDTLLCGGPIAISPLSALSPSLSFSWMNGSSSQSITVTSSTMVILNVSDSLNCISRDTMSIVINTIPLQPGFISGNFNPCLGSGQSYSVPVSAGAANYTWTLPASWNGTFTMNSGSVITGTAGGSIFVVAGNSCGISPSQSLAVSVNSIPATPGIISGPVALCLGAPAQMYSVIPVSGASGYTWSLPSGWTGSSSGNILNAGPGTASGTLYSAASNSCGISSAQMLAITINTLPVISLFTSTSTVCEGNSVILTASGVTTFTWSTAENTSSISVVPLSNTTYSINGTDLNGCSDSGSISISVIPLPTVSITGNTVICNGELVTLYAGGASSYTWNTTATTQSLSTTPTVSTSYSVTGTGTNGCISSTSQSVTVNPLPTVSISGNTSMCAGNALVLSGAGATTYMWSNASISSSISVSPLATTSYTLLGTDQNSCSAIAVKTITVNTLPLVSISGNSIICAGESLILTAAGAASYTWNTTATGFSISAQPLAFMSYSVLGSDVNGCYNTALKNVLVNPLPGVSVLAIPPLICAGETATLFAASANTFTWNTGAVSSSISVQPVSTTVYTVTGTDLNTCSKSVTITQNVNVCTGIITDTAVPEDFRIYPNPNNGSFNLEIKQVGMFTFKIFNIMGQEIYSKELTQGSDTVQLDVKQGIYSYKLISGAKTLYTGKIVIN